MNTFRRLTASLCTLLLLQLTLLGSGTLCAMRGAAATGTHDMSAMAGMAASGSDAAPSGAIVGAGDPSDVPPMGGHPDDGCRMPWAPGQCASMTACAMSATPVARSATLVTLRVVRLELPSLTLLHSGPTFAPELPPPRA